MRTVTCPTCGREYLDRADAGAGTLGWECAPCRRDGERERSAANLAAQILNAKDAPWPSARLNWKERGW